MPAHSRIRGIDARMHCASATALQVMGLLWSYRRPDRPAPMSTRLPDAPPASLRQQRPRISKHRRLIGTAE